MKLLEYEAKQILSEFSIPTPQGFIVRTTKDNIESPVVLKSQVPIGGRGKAGGIVVVENQEQAQATIAQLLQLDIHGYTPNVLLAEEKLAIKQEFYLSLVVNRQHARIELIAHTEGGIEVESNQHESFLRLDLSSSGYDTLGQSLADYYDLPDQTFVLQDLVENLHACFVQSDATLLEINPLILTKENKLVAGDCKMTLDDAAAFRHPEWNFEQQKTDSNFVILDEYGTVATVANGAGLAMATVDAVANVGLKPANFLDIGGGANAESVLAAFRRIQEFPNIQAIVINIFAGITRCDEVAKAIIAARAQIDNLPPLFIRLAGTNYEKAAMLLEEYDIKLLPTLDSAITAASGVHHG